MTTEPTPAPTSDSLPTDDAPETPTEDPTAKAPTTAAPAAPTPGAPAKGVRTGTVVWGLVLAVCGVGLVAAATGHRYDLGLAVIVVVAAAGLALLVGSLVSAGRRR